MSAPYGSTAAGGNARPAGVLADFGVYTCADGCTRSFSTILGRRCRSSANARVFNALEVGGYEPEPVWSLAQQVHPLSVEKEAVLCNDSFPIPSNVPVVPLRHFGTACCCAFLELNPASLPLFVVAPRKIAGLQFSPKTLMGINSSFPPSFA